MINPKGLLITSKRELWKILSTVGNFKYTPTFDTDSTTRLKYIWVFNLFEQTIKQLSDISKSTEEMLLPISDLARNSQAAP